MRLAAIERLVLLSLLGLFVVSSAFHPLSVVAFRSRSFVRESMMSSSSELPPDTTQAPADCGEQHQQPHPFSLLPGDPSLILTTNIDLGSKKMDIMKACSKAIAKHTGKPELYVAVAINDKADVIFSGTDAPAALGMLCSIGSINKESNGKITADVTDLLQEFGLDEARIYINFFDLDRANIGWSRSTFAG